MSTLPKLPTHHRQSFGGFWRSHLRRRPRRVSRGVASAARGSLGAVPEDGAGESAGALPCYPAAMFQQRLIEQQAIKGIKLFGQGHLIKQQVNTIVTLATNIDTGNKLLTGIFLLEKTSSVHFFRNQVMKGENCGSLA